MVPGAHCVAPHHRQLARPTAFPTASEQARLTVRAHVAGQILQTAPLSHLHAAATHGRHIPSSVQASTCAWRALRLRLPRRWFDGVVARRRDGHPKYNLGTAETRTLVPYAAGTSIEYE